MSGIAELLINLGHNVSGSDMARTKVTERLANLGGKIYIGHATENVSGADVVVVSSAVSRDNPEVISAKKQSIPVIMRAEMLAELMRLKYGIAVGGSHGKTTTTSLVGSVLLAGKLDPTVVIGGRLNNSGTGARLGEGEYLVAEADESDGSFLKLMPTIAVVTNIDYEHIDHYGSREVLVSTFLDFINKIPFYGTAILCIDNDDLRNLMVNYEKRYLSYGFSEDADIRAEDIVTKGGTNSFDILFKGERLGRVELHLAGRHNVLNALAAVGVGLELGVPFEAIQRGLESFAGVERRFQFKGERDGVTIIDDYGHHPTEIAATLSAAREVWPERRLITVFQPHRYSRTRDLKGMFGDTFLKSDILLITPIYSAGEKPIEGISAATIVKEAKEGGADNVTLVKDLDDVVTRLREVAKPGDVIITMGAGDVVKVAGKYLEEDI